ncbi:DUF2378 family protein [Sorangium sp. So ce1036]|uniref:DUF2378 family protein n=1 Tax=Sorangium sp. So ce1036 TaxID=3133328 RepID=UPI003F0F3F52
MKEVRSDQRVQAGETPVPRSGVLRTVTRGIMPASVTVGEGPFAGSSGGSFEVRPSDSLLGNIDIEAVLASVPEFHAVKGMFFNALAATLGERFTQVVATLSSPPRGGLYLPFSDYPMRDFLRLYDAAARLSHPNRSSREAYRRLARQQVSAFRESALGRITMHLATDPGAALMRYTGSLGALTKGPTARARQLGPSEVQIDISGYRGVLEYPLGNFEALVMGYGAKPTVAVDVRSPDALRFVVSW